MGPLQAMDRSTVAAPPHRARTAPIGRRLRLQAPALLVLLALAAALAPLLHGGSSGEAGPGTAPRHAALAGIPESARAEVSAALGAEQPAYAVHGSPGSPSALTAADSTQSLRANFTSAGLRIAAPGVAAGFSLRQFGADGSLRPVAAASPTAHANRVYYARGEGLTEWYANGPAGLEQGFTVARAPRHAASAQLTLSLALASGAAHASLGKDAQSLMLRSGAHELRYGGLAATDASGRALRSRLALDAGRLLIRVDATGARYPLRIDPLIEAGGKLTGGGEEGEGQFGTSVALSADGDTLLVGGPHDTNPNHGAAWVFARSGSTWVQQGPKLTGAEGVTPVEAEEEQCAEESSEEAGECAFGASVALSADGNTALIGEPSATTRPGSAWVFTRSGSGAEAKWTKSTILPGEGASRGGRFGKSVALSADGATALIGDPSANAQHGSAWVFALSGASATVQGTLGDPQAGHFDHVGRSVALSGDGSTALIGAPGDSEYAGAALVFTRSGETWSREPGKLQGEAESGEARFGKSVALSGDGQTALVGGQNDNGNRGAAWGFVRSGGSFAPQGGKLVAAEEIEAHFGASVALSGNGSIGLIGAPRGGGGGEATELVHSGSSWELLPELLETADESGKGWLGSAVALSSEGKLAAVGAPHDHARIGAAWVFAEPPVVAPPPPAVTTVLPGFGPAGTVVRVKGSGFTSATNVWFGSVPAEFKVKSGVTIEATAPAGVEVGVVDVTVKTNAGVSALNAGDTFRFTSSGSGPGGPDKKGGGTTTSETPAPTPTGTSPSTGNSATKASGGVLASASASAACQVALRSKRLAVTSFRTVALRLMRTGSGSCSGKLTLSFNSAHKGKRARPIAIGTASYSISTGTSKVFKIALDKAGRKLFRAHGGKLNVSLAIVRAVPAPRLAKSASVRLTWKKTRKSLTLTK
jgi:FG-GAP repeat